MGAERTGQDSDGIRVGAGEVLRVAPGAAFPVLRAGASTWDALDGALRIQAEDAARQGRTTDAARLTLQRARLESEQRRRYSVAAAHFEQAAELHAGLKEWEAALHLRLLWLRALRDAQGSPRGLAESARQFLSHGARLGQVERARRFLARIEGGDLGGKAEEASSRRALQLELLEAAEAAEGAGRFEEAAALFTAAWEEHPDARMQRRLEAHYVARQAWGELAQFYRMQAERAERSTVRQHALARLAEVLERELGDFWAAADVYGELWELMPLAQPLGEQVRLYEQLGRPERVERTLASAWERANTPESQAAVRVIRGERALRQGQPEQARADFLDALSLWPLDVRARMGLVELEVERGNTSGVPALCERLEGLPRRAPGRTELFRRLARLAEGRGLDSDVIRLAWTEAAATENTDADAPHASAAPPTASAAPPTAPPTTERELPRVTLEEAAEPVAFPASDPEPVTPGTLEVAVLDPMEVVTTGDWVLVEADDRRDTEELPVSSPPTPAGREEAWVSAAVPVLPRAAPVPRSPHAARRMELIAQVRAAPLAPEGYLQLAENFREAEDLPRAELMAEIAAALQAFLTPHSPAPSSEAAPPRLLLSATDRAGLRHPGLRGEAGELFGLVGASLCRVLADEGPSADSHEVFRLDAGKGAGAVAEALLCAVRTLGLRAPDVDLSDEAGPPFALVSTREGPRLRVGRQAVRQKLPAAELRFFAGRALFGQNPDLLALRNLPREQLLRGLLLLRGVLRGQAARLGGDAVLLDGALPSKARARVLELLTKAGPELPLPSLTEAARHSANRAGLVVAGSLGPVLAALRAKQALPAEVVELVRFAASERFLQLRSRQLS